VLSTRPRKSGAAYASIWNRELNESPLRTITRSQAEQLSAALSDLGDIEVDWAMRYGNPSIAEVLARMLDKGCRRIAMIPLYPQDSTTTTATVNDKFFEALMRLRWQPAVRTAAPWYDDPLYIDALANSIDRHLATQPVQP